ncbi:MAG: MucBP domain-containing protein, partial [Bacilli bacterium]
MRNQKVRRKCRIVLFALLIQASLFVNIPSKIEATSSEETSENISTEISEEVVSDNSADEVSEVKFTTRAITNLNSIIVYYVDEETGEQIAPAFKTLLATGEEWSATSPTIGGYTLT